jgi:hypothetical protein
MHLQKNCRVVKLHDVLQCDKCGGVMRLIAAIHTPEATQKILDCLGLPSRAPPMASAVPRTPLSLRPVLKIARHSESDTCVHFCTSPLISSVRVGFVGPQILAELDSESLVLPSLIQPCSPRAFRMDVLLGQNGNGFGFDHQLFAGQFSDLYQCASRGILAVVLARMSRSAFSRPHGTHLDSVKIGEIHPCSELR